MCNGWNKNWYVIVVCSRIHFSSACRTYNLFEDEECERDFFNLKGTHAPGHSGALMIDFFRPLNLNIPSREQSKKIGAPAIREAYNNSAGFLHDLKKTWQILCPIPIRQITSVIFDILTLKTRPQELLMNDSEHFRKCLRSNIGDFTFQEAFDRTGRILNITGKCTARFLELLRTPTHLILPFSVTPNNSSDPPRLLNYLTAPHCLVWSATVASSSLPGKFPSIWFVFFHKPTT